MAKYTLEYSKSARAKCRRCQDTVPEGALRTGETTDVFGHESVGYRHWGCSTKEILRTINLQTPGFHELRAEDQRRVIMAMNKRKIPEEDLTPCLRPAGALPTGLAKSSSVIARKTEVPSATNSWMAPAEEDKKGAVAPSAFNFPWSSRPQGSDTPSWSRPDEDAGVKAAIPSSSSSSVPRTSAPLWSRPDEDEGVKRAIASTASTSSSSSSNSTAGAPVWSQPVEDEDVKRAIAAFSSSKPRVPDTSNSSHPDEDEDIKMAIALSLQDAQRAQPSASSSSAFGGSSWAPARPKIGSSAPNSLTGSSAMHNTLYGLPSLSAPNSSKLGPAFAPYAGMPGGWRGDDTDNEDVKPSSSSAVASSSKLHHSTPPTSASGPSSRKNSNYIDLTSSPLPDVKSAFRGVKREAAMLIDSDDDEDLKDIKPNVPNAAIELEDDVFYVRTYADVVGITHYNGKCAPYEVVTLLRDPTNIFDPKAIRVMNSSGIQIGSLSRGVSANLAGLMDGGLITPTAKMITGNNVTRTFKLRMSIDIYGPPSSRAALAPSLAWAGPLSTTGLSPEAAHAKAMADAAAAMAPTASTSATPDFAFPPGLRNFDGSGFALPGYEQLETEEEKAAQEVMAALQQLNSAEHKADDFLEALTKAVDVLKLPMHPDPPSKAKGQLLNDLLPHQSQGLLWMQQHENPVLPEGEEHVQLWRRRGDKIPHWFNVATKITRALKHEPVLGRGGILADCMGLGKTISILALILATKQEPAPGFCGATLIVCPLSVLSNWESQIDEHAAPGQLKYIVFYGDGREVSQAKLEKADVVITTYQVVTSEQSTRPSKAKKAKTGQSTGRLIDTKWKRIVLDEGHTIRNAATGMARACTALEAHRRWVVSGTPIVNGPKDLGSLLSFLRVCRPLDDPTEFKNRVVRALKPGKRGSFLLQAIMSQSCLRRTKEMEDEDGKRLVPLPPVIHYDTVVELTPEDRRIYDTAMTISRDRIVEALREGDGAPPPSHVLAMLTRLRQLSLFTGLVPSNYLRTLQKEQNLAVAISSVSDEDRVDLLWKLKAAVDDNEECPVCFETLNQPRITICGHVYCLPCIQEVMGSEIKKCPMDRTDLLSADHLLELPAVMPPKREDPAKKEETEEEDTAADLPVIETGNGLKSSAKIDELLRYLKLFPKTQKSLVFSQFTGFLDAIEPHLKEAGIRFVRFDGTMNQTARAEVLQVFQRPLAPKSGPSQDVKDVKEDVDTSATEDSDAEYAPPFRKASVKGKGRASALSKGEGKARGGDDDYDPNGPTVMLISLKAGAVGLNLTAASAVFLMDPWWAAAIESQAIDRVNRIGQTAKEVRVFQVIAKNTIEEKVLEIQARKNALVKSAFAGIKNKQTARERKEARYAELRELFGIPENN